MRLRGGRPFQNWFPSVTSHVFATPNRPVATDSMWPAAAEHKPPSAIDSMRAILRLKYSPGSCRPAAQGLKSALRSSRTSTACSWRAPIAYRWMMRAHGHDAEIDAVGGDNRRGRRALNLGLLTLQCPRSVLWDVTRIAAALTEKPPRTGVVAAPSFSRRIHLRNQLAPSRAVLARSRSSASGREAACFVLRHPGLRAGGRCAHESVRAWNERSPGRAD